MTRPNDKRTSLDAVVRGELFHEAPADLTSALLHLARQASAGTLEPLPPAAWYRLTVLLLTALAVAVSVALASQLYGLLITEIGLVAWWAQVQQTVAASWQQVAAALPASQFVLDVLASIRTQLYWLLAAVILWLALDDNLTPPLAPQQRTAS